VSAYYNKNQFPDLDESHRLKLEEELKQLKIVEDKLRYLNNKRDEVREATEKEKFDTNIKGKTFIWKRDKQHLSLVKATSCTSFGMYNSCNTISLILPSNNTDIYNQIHFNLKDTQRVDMLGKEYVKATPEDIEGVRQLLYNQVDRYIASFK